MRIVNRYFKFTGGPLIERIREDIAKRATSRKELSKISLSIGATKSYYESHGKLVAFDFEDSGAVDRSLFRRSGDGWLPKMSRKFGREIMARVDAVDCIDIQSSVEAVGLEAGLPGAVFFDYRIYVVTLGFIDNPDEPIAVVVTPTPTIDDGEYPEIFEFVNKYSAHEIEARERAEIFEEAKS